jgi:TPP-dependent pyruvate/acetoin dehydrogenase alpha subunit
MTIATTGQGTAELAGHQGFSIISNEKLCQLYISMVKCRLLAERLQNRAGETASGHEAAAAGVISALLPGDAVAVAQGNLIALFLQNEQRDKPLKALLARAAETDFAAQLKLTLRTAQANKTAGNGKIAVAFFSKDEHVPEKTLQQASAKRLPVLFVRQATVFSDAFGAPISGVPAIPVDGRDVVAVYRVATESVTHARKGNGPTLIECIFDPTEAHDPILKMEAYLTRKGLFREAWKLEEVANFTQELDAVTEAARA